MSTQDSSGPCTPWSSYWPRADLLCWNGEGALPPLPAFAHGEKPEGDRRRVPEVSGLSL